MLERALCLVLILQCVLGDGHNSVEEILDRIEDYADTLGLETEKDEFYWEEAYWRPPFQHVLQCPDGYGWEGEFEDGHCEICPAGHYSERGEFGLQSRCKPCLPGEFDNAEGRGWCDGHCRYGTTFQTGSTSESDCVNPDEMFEGSFESEVSVEVTMSGDWSFLNDLLMEASGFNFYEAKAYADYREDDHVSILQVAAMLPNNIAVHAHGFLLQFKTYKDSINDYSALGDHYTKIIFNMLNNAETFKEFGWKMNHEQLRVKDAEIRDVRVHLKQHCEDGYKSAEWEGVGTRCIKEEDTGSIPSLKNSVFIQYVGESHDCMSLGGEARLRDFVHHHWPFPCMDNEECEAHFSTCEILNSGECAILIHLIFYDEEAGQGTVESNLNRAMEVEYHEGSSFKYSEDNSYKFRDSGDCGADPKIASDGSISCSRECDSENGYRLTKSGNCHQCPYGTWFYDDESEGIFPRCYSCSFYKSSTIFGKVPKRAADCSNDGTYSNRNSDGVWTGHSNYVATDFKFEVMADVEMHLCTVMKIKQDFDNFCSEMFSMDNMALDDFTNFDVEMLGCLVMQEFSEIYEHSCNDFDRSWSDIMDDFEWEDVACFVAKGIHRIEDEDGSCEDLSDDDKSITMPFEFSESFSNWEMAWSNAFYLPLLSQVRKLNRFDSNAVSMTMEGLFRKLGMYDMTDLTGLEMMDHVRDMILEIPRGVGVVDSSFDFMTTDDDIFCDDGSVRVSCSYADSCDWQKCNSDDYDEAQLECSHDPCNGCQPKWTWNGDSVTCPAKRDCTPPNNVNDAIMFSTNERDYVSYVCDGCDNYARTYKYVCEEDFRLDNIKESEYDSGSEYGEPDHGSDYYSGYECEAEVFYCKSTDYEINRLPNCVRDTCRYDNLENGFIKRIQAERDSPCRCAEYQCDPGYEMEGNSKVYCSTDGSYTEMPRCVKAECEFPDEMNNAKFIAEYVNWRGDREAWYQCQHGTSIYGDVYGNIECGEESRCERRNYCPAVIENGYLMREWRWEEYSTYIGEYRCNEGFELRNPKIFSASQSDYEAMYGWGACGMDRERDPDPENMPRCVEPGSPEPCDMPERIMNGYRVSEIMNEEFDVIDHASYRCNSGYRMMETWKGDIGWCRHDGTYELPHCVLPREWMDVEFELVPGMSKMENAGRVKARDVYADGSKGEWYAGCDDHFNGPAAGAICRSLGFRHGKQIAGDRKMKPIEDIPFGKTNVWCYHDDVLITSPSCNSDDYGQMGWPLCTPEEQIAVHCFDEMWKVDVGFNMVERNGKMSCPVMAWKEGNMMKLKNMDVHVKWGGVHMLAGDDYEVEYFEEGVHYVPQGKFSKKKGFKARFIGNKMDYDCFFCDVYMGEHIMNPWPDKNHNCPMEEAEPDN